MSSRNTIERIKEVRQFYRADSIPPFSDPIPLGTDADLVDVYSGLDLEQELLLGGNKTTSLTFKQGTDGSKITLIIQKFYEKEFLQTAIYTKKTYIKETPIIDLIEGQNQNDVIGDNNTEEESTNFVIGNFRGTNNIIVYIYLYDGDLKEKEEGAEEEEGEKDCTLIHKKRIIVKSNQIIETLDQFDQKEVEI